MYANIKINVTDINVTFKGFNPLLNPLFFSVILLISTFFYYISYFFLMLILYSM